MGFVAGGAPKVHVPCAWQVMEQNLIAVELHSTTVSNSRLNKSGGTIRAAARGLSSLSGLGSMTSLMLRA